MRYTSIRAVRRITGKRPKREVTYAIGTTDGVGKIFYIKHRFLADGNGDEIIDSNDITVYVNGTSVTIADINTFTGAITLADVPLTDLAVTADFFWHDYDDSEIIEDIEHFSRLIEHETGTKFYPGNQTTEKVNGTGTQKRFFFGKGKPITEIVSYSIDEVTTGLVLNTDYFLYPDDDRAFFIEFISPPLWGHKNVQLTYKYGESNPEVSRWVLLNVAKNMFRGEMGERRNIGSYSIPKADGTTIVASNSMGMLRLFEEEIKKSRANITGLIRVSLSGSEDFTIV